MATVWADGFSLTRTQSFGFPIWMGTIPADTRPGPQTVYFLGKNVSGALASYIAVYQVQPPPPPPRPYLVPLPLSGDGAFRFAFTNSNATAFAVLATTNAALPSSNWTLLGSPSNSGGGIFQFSDPSATNYPRRFYRLRWP